MADKLSLDKVFELTGHDYGEKECSKCEGFCCSCELCDCCVRINIKEAKQQIIAYFETKIPNKYINGKQSGELGVATNLSFTEGYNAAIAEIKQALKEDING